MVETDVQPGSDARLARWQFVTVASLFVGYAGYYICRSNLSVATPLLIHEYGSAGVTKAQIGDIASAGVLLYAIGKLINGLATDRIGAKRMFLGGMLLSIACTVLFVMPRVIGVFGPMMVVWSINRFVQSAGWGGLVQIASHWFAAHRYAAVMGVLSMSYLVGDAVARLLLGAVISQGADARGVFLAAAGVLGLIAIGCLIATRNRPGDVGLPEHHLPAPDTPTMTASTASMVSSLLANPAFVLVCLMNVGLTTIRETFNLWTPTYLNEVAKLSPGVAGMTSLLFPLVGAASSVLAGVAVVAVGNRYGVVIIPSLLGLIAVLGTMAVLPIADYSENWRPGIALTLVSLAAFFLLAPYTFCSGALAMKLGGVRGAAASAGIIDTAGYLGAITAGSVIGRVATAAGWGMAFLVLAITAALTLLVAIGYTSSSERARSRDHARDHARDNTSENTNDPAEQSPSDRPRDDAERPPQ